MRVFAALAILRGPAQGKETRSRGRVVRDLSVRQGLLLADYQAGLEHCLSLLPVFATDDS